MLLRVFIWTKLCFKRAFKSLPESFAFTGIFIFCISGSHFTGRESNFNSDPDKHILNTARPPVESISWINSRPALIYGISVNSITANSAIISWTTNLQSTSQIKYGTTTSYGLSTLVDEVLVSSHSQVLHGLAPNTLYHFKVISGSDSSADNSFTTASLSASPGSLNSHTVRAYPSGKIVPWTSNPANGYDTVMFLAWKYLLNTVPNDPLTGKPAYYSRSYINPNTQQMVNWDHNPAGLYAMLVESALKYYAYSGNANVMQLANDVALWHLDHGMTNANDSWASVPYSEGPYGSLNYGGANQADGIGNLEPDKVGALAHAWFQLYKYNGNIRFRDAAIQAGNVLADKVRTGNQTQSPWPFRVDAIDGSSIEDYCANVIQPIELFDDLIAAGVGNTAAYQTARTTAWNWMMTYPMQNNIWAQYFEDVSMQQNYNSNLNQLVAGMTARYLLEHPEFDPNWETHVRGIITWIENVFGQAQYGATTIKEQIVFPWVMGSHTARYASINALLYEKTGDLAAKEKAYRSFNWATYMCRINGVVIDGLLYGDAVNANQWFTDGYGDYIRHFMTGIAAMPEWSPANQTHLLRSSSLIQNISYGANSVNYTTYDSSAVTVLHINFNPGTITANGVTLPKRFNLSQPGWTLNAATKTLKIYHTNATQISINAEPAVSVNPVCPGSNAYFSQPRPGNGYFYQWQIDSTGNGFIDLINNAVHSGVSTDTLRLNAPPASYHGFKYRCFAYKGDTLILGTPNVLRFTITWHGNTSAEWGNTANWSCNSLPNGLTDVIIPVSVVNNPVITNDAVVYCLKISAGAILTVNPGIRLEVKGK